MFYVNKYVICVCPKSHNVCLLSFRGSVKYASPPKKIGGGENFVPSKARVLKCCISVFRYHHEAVHLPAAGRGGRHLCWSGLLPATGRSPVSSQRLWLQQSQLRQPARQEAGVSVPAPIVWFSPVQSEQNMIDHGNSAKTVTPQYLPNEYWHSKMHSPAFGRPRWNSFIA